MLFQYANSAEANFDELIDHPVYLFSFLRRNKEFFARQLLMISSNNIEFQCTNAFLKYLKISTFLLLVLYSGTAL